MLGARLANVIRWNATKRSRTAAIVPPLASMIEQSVVKAEQDCADHQSIKQLRGK